MNAIRNVAFVLILLSASPGVAAVPEKRAFDDAVTRSMKTWSVPGAAVVIVKDGQVNYLAGHGVREVGKDAAVTPDTLFAMGSCSKAFTTAAMAALVDEGKLAWDDRVRDHLPGFRLSEDDLLSREVRLRDLVCHRTGLAANDLLWYRAPWSPEEGVKRLAFLPLARPFRTTLQYNSVTFTAAGLAAARAADTTWPELIRQRLLAPLGMKRTQLDVTAAAKDSDRTRGHRLNRASEAEVEVSANMRTPDAAGSIYSSARELIPWMRLHLDGGTHDGKRLVSVRSLRQTHTPQIPIRHGPAEVMLFPDTIQSSYAMAWVILDHRGHKLIAHGGALDGERAQILLVPEKKLGIAVLSNLHQTSLNHALAMTLMEMILEVPKKRDWDAIHKASAKRRTELADTAQRDRLARQRHDTKQSRELGAYVGTYTHPAFGPFRIVMIRSALHFEYRGEILPLQHFHHDTFVMASDLTGDAELTFALDERGGVKRCDITGNFNVSFTRSAK